MRRELADAVEICFEHGLHASLTILLWCHGLLPATPENSAIRPVRWKDFRPYLLPGAGQVEGLPFAGDGQRR